MAKSNFDFSLLPAADLSRADRAGAVDHGALQKIRFQ